MWTASTARRSCAEEVLELGLPSRLERRRLFAWKTVRRKPKVGLAPPVEILQAQAQESPIPGLDRGTEIPRGVMELNRAFETISVRRPDTVSQAFASALERALGEKSSGAQDAVPGFRATRGEGRFRPGHDAIAAAVVLEIVAEPTELHLPAGPRSFELVVPLGVRAESQCTSRRRVVPPSDSSTYSVAICAKSSGLRLAGSSSRDLSAVSSTAGSQPPTNIIVKTKIVVG